MTFYKNFWDSLQRNFLRKGHSLFLFNFILNFMHNVFI